MDNFDEIPGLVCYINAAIPESITKTGDKVTSVASQAGSGGETFIAVDSGAAYIAHDGTTLIGSMPAFYVNGTEGPDLQATFTTRFEPGDPHTVCWVEERANTSGVNTTFALIDHAARERTRVARSSSNYSLRMNGSDVDTSVPIVSQTPQIFIHSNAGTADSGVWDIGGTRVTPTHAAESQPLEIVRHFGFDSQGTKVGIGVVYNRVLNDTEKTDVQTLIQYWLDNGEGPSTAPTSGQFGPMTTNKDGEVTQWAWEESSDDTNWQPVGTLIADVSNANTNTLLVNSATVGEHGTYVRCVADTASQQAISASAQLLIDGQ